MPSDGFYRGLAPFSDFHGITADRHFAPVPGDWWVVITDVRGSTKAIEAGRYKDVNTVGAATIAAVQNALGDLDFPFVFGGDGATLVLPEDAFARSRQALVDLRALSERTFALGLRVGAVPVSEVQAAGGRIEVAKLALAEGKNVAIFRGGGLTVAEGIVKGSDAYELEGEPDGGAASLEGLSCRWQPIPSRAGTILSLLVMATDDTDAAPYDAFLAALDEILGGDVEGANPIHLARMTYKSVRECLADEKRYHRSIWHPAFWARAVEIVLAVGIFKLGLPAPFDAKRYAASMRTHSDYRKFDDTLRMIIDCSDEQAARIEAYLASRHASGKLFYGVHRAPTSLMTCYVQGLDEGEHIHFVDGGDGGYAMAAKGLKAQLKGAGE